jgi:hypothetical protein
MGMIVMAHNGAVLMRIGQQRLSKRGQKFRQLLGLKRYNINKINPLQGAIPRSLLRSRSDAFPSDTS